MVITIRDSTGSAESMVRELLIGMMDLSTQAISKIIKFMEMESINGRTAENTTVSGKIKKCTAEVSLHGPMVEFTLENTSKTKSKAMAR